jgi:tetratricopeptide (TPR) repeat protein
LNHQARQLNQQAIGHFRQGRYAAATKHLRQALEIRELLYSADKYPSGHPDLATSLNNLGQLLQCQGDYAGALAFSRRALAMYERLYPKAKYSDGHPDLASSLSNVGLGLEHRGDYAGALGYF